MITYVYGSLFYSPARVLVNPVNTVGAMGSGLAYDFKRFFPDMYEQYRKLCQRDAFTIGQVMLYRTPHKWVLNFPTRRHFRAASSVDTIAEGLQKFAIIAADQQLVSVSFPAFGALAAESDDDLAWSDVRPVMEAYLAPLPLSIFIHLPDSDSPYPQPVDSTRAMRAWLAGQPQQLAFVTFARALQRALKEKNHLQTVDGTPFKAVMTPARGRQRLSLKLTPERGQSIFLPETQVRDLWQYIRRAGYIIPQNLPNGLEDHAPFIVALLGQLPFLRLIQLEGVNGQRFTGLHYIPPLDRSDDLITVNAN